MTTAADRIAIVGMAGRFPGAPDIEILWRNLCEGVESVRSFSNEELRQAGVNPRVIDDPDYVNAGAPLEDADAFDAAFFGVMPREAELMDPQHRIFLESAWAALEDAGCDPNRFDGRIGVFGGVARNTYFLHNAPVYRALVESGATYEALLGSDKDFTATRVAYKLNLTGPALSVQTACSSSGVALHLACQSLLNGECDAAVVGGARVHLPQTAGYHWVPGGIPSRDGHCRPFDEGATGCIYGSGVAIVVLKRLEDAIQARDRIYSVILATALNNDGADKAGFTAPSVSGQTRVVAEALAVGDVDPESIQYVEAHGTGTTLGDPIEVSALTRAFRQKTNAVQYCGLGSLKANIGHLDAGAGVAGLIKLSLMLSRRKLLPSINFSTPNPELNLATTPFYVNTEFRDWPEERRPRRGAISSFGLGGTNFHAIVEEPPNREDSAPARSAEVLLLSAKTPAALTRSAKNLARFLASSPALNYSDVAFTLATGRRPMPVRQFVVCQDLPSAVAKLEKIAGGGSLPMPRARRVRNTIFMFTGQGSQYPRMTFGLYEQDRVFRRAFDDCCEGFQSHLDLDLRALIFCSDGGHERAEKALSETRITQPALFAVEYSLVRSLQSRGVTPAALVGHSIGELVAATVAGVFRFEDAMAIVAKRAALMQAAPTGKMVAVQLSAEDVEPLLPPELEIAAVNAPELVVVAGSDTDVTRFQGMLDKREVGWRQIRTSHAFHSRLMESAVAPFTAFVSQFSLKSPAIPIVSNVTGSWLRDEEATQPAYWGKHIRHTVLFNRCLESLLGLDDPAFVEVGPGSALTSIVRQKTGPVSSHAIISCVRDARVNVDDQVKLLAAYGELWANGADLDTRLLFPGSDRTKVSLPTYPFERQRYWLSSKQGLTDAPRQGEAAGHAQSDSPSAEPAENVALMQLKNMLHVLVDAESKNPGLLEIGLDSSFLTRARAAIERRLQAMHASKQGIENIRALRSFAEPRETRSPDVIDAVLPPGATATEAPATKSASPRPSADRGAQMVESLQSLFAELSGMDAASLDPRVTFLELGLDSLFLTRASGAIKKQFAFTVSLRQLLREYSTIETLATHMVSTIPVDPAPERIARAPATPPATKPDSALIYPMSEAFYFGPRDRQLFANYHLPARGNGRVLTVICPPLFSDYMRTQLALRKLAISLAESGQHVLRLDYRGTGDSFGDLADVSISDWVEDIALAVREGRELSGSNVVRVLGVRAGALLACRSVGAVNEVNRLVLWDPVPDGTGYLESLRRVQLAMIEQNYYLRRAERRKAIHEYAGYRLSGRMTEQFRTLGGDTYSSVPAGKLHIVSTTPVNGFPVQGAPHDIAQFTCDWETDSEDVLMPRVVLERLIECLTQT